MNNWNSNYGARVQLVSWSYEGTIKSEEQRKRIVAEITDPAKAWFPVGDVMHPLEMTAAPLAEATVQATDLAAWQKMVDGKVRVGQHIVRIHWTKDSKPFTTICTADENELIYDSMLFNAVLVSRHSRCLDYHIGWIWQSKWENMTRGAIWADMDLKCEEGKPITTSSGECVDFHCGAWMTAGEAKIECTSEAVGNCCVGKFAWAWACGFKSAKVKKVTVDVKDKFKFEVDAEIEGYFGSSGMGKDTCTECCPEPRKPPPPPPMTPTEPSSPRTPPAPSPGTQPPTPTPAPAQPEKSSTGAAFPPQQPLPPGAVFAVASVDPETTIEVEQPGYALVATADVVTAKRVNPGDHLDPKTTSSIAFDNGTGVLIEKVKKVGKELGPPLLATVGLMHLFQHDHPQQLPVQNGSTTMYVGSDKPFTTPVLSIDNINKMPDQVQAVFLNPRGEKVGQLSTYNGLQLQASNKIAIRTVDSNGVTLQQGNVEPGALDTSAKVTFDRTTYKAGQHGTLQIRVGNYEQGIAMTRFGGAGNLSNEKINIVPLSDVKGLPSEVPFGDANLPFQTMHPGQARVAVFLPRSVPPKPIANPENDALKQANQTFENWLTRFRK